MFEVLVQPAQDVQHESTISDINAKVGEGVGKALHLRTVVIDAEVALNKALEGGIDVEGVGFVVAEEVVLQCQLGIASYVATLPCHVLQVRGDGALDPQLNNTVHPIPSQNADVRGVQGHVIR
jgi:hypothetical protein